MKDVLVAALASLGLLGFIGTGQMRAQYPLPGRPGAVPPVNPVLSPYLNITRPGNPAINYYGLVRPQQQYNADINSLQQQITTGRQAQGSTQLPGYFVTGHPVQFLNYHRYFLNTGAVSPFAGAPAPAGAAAAAGPSTGGGAGLGRAASIIAQSRYGY